MRQKSVPQTSSAEKTIKDIRRVTRKHRSAEDKFASCGRPAWRGQYRCDLPEQTAIDTRSSAAKPFSLYLCHDMIYIVNDR